MLVNFEDGALGFLRKLKVSLTRDGRLALTSWTRCLSFLYLLYLLGTWQPPAPVLRL